MAGRIPSSNLPVTTAVGRIADAKKRTRQEDESLGRYAPPHRAQRNYIPSPTSSKT